MPHVGVDQQDPLAHLRKNRRKICREPTAAFTATRAGYRQNSTTHAVDPTKRQLASQGAQGFDEFALRQIRCNHVIRHAILTAAREDRIVELLSQRHIDVILSQQIQLQSSFTEADAVLSCEPLDLLDVLLPYSALLHENRSKCPALIARGRFSNCCGLASYFFHYSVLHAN